MADKRIHDLETEIVEYQDKDQDWLAVDGDGTGTSQDKTQKMTFDNLASSVGKLLNNENDDTATLTNKSIDSDNNTITNIVNADIKAAAGIDASKMGSGDVSNTEFDYLDGVTSAIQTQFSDIETGKLERDQQEGANGSSTLAATPTISAESQVIGLSGSMNAVNAKLTAISATYAQTIIVKCVNATNNCTVAAAVADSGFVESDGTLGTTITFDAADEFVILKSSTISGGYWVIVGGIYTLT